MKIGWYSVVISPTQAKEIAVQKAEEHVQLEHFNITPEELEKRIIARSNEGAFNYFLYCADLDEVTAWQNYLNPLGYGTRRIPAMPGEKYDYILKISWE